MSKNIYDGYKGRYFLDVYDFVTKRTMLDVTHITMSKCHEKLGDLFLFGHPVW